MGEVLPDGTIQGYTCVCGKPCNIQGQHSGPCERPRQRSVREQAIDQIAGWIWSYADEAHSPAEVLGDAADCLDGLIADGLVRLVGLEPLQSDARDSKYSVDDELGPPVYQSDETKSVGQ